MAIKPSDQKDLAEAILALSYVDMTDLGDALASSSKSDVEDGIKFDAENRDHWCERLRWWATCHLDALEDDSNED
jgi:uncharacterized protein with von Willebrand factor type A (vWA) domain